MAEKLAEFIVSADKERKAGNGRRLKGIKGERSEFQYPLNAGLQ